MGGSDPPNWMGHRVRVRVRVRVILGLGLGLDMYVRIRVRVRSGMLFLPNVCACPMKTEAMPYPSV